MKIMIKNDDINKSSACQVLLMSHSIYPDDFVYYLGIAKIYIEKYWSDFFVALTTVWNRYVTQIKHFVDNKVLNINNVREILEMFFF